jgi:hypothetical protein
LAFLQRHQSTAKVHLSFTTVTDRVCEAERLRLRDFLIRNRTYDYDLVLRMSPATH